MQNERSKKYVNFGKEKTSEALYSGIYQTWDKHLCNANFVTANLFRENRKGT